MASNLLLNQFAPNTPIDGMYVYMANEGQLHNVIVGEGVTLKAGDVVVLDTDSTNVHAPVVIGGNLDLTPFGVVSYNPIKSTYTEGERVGLAREGDVIWKTAKSAIAVGDYVTFDETDFKVKTISSSGPSTYIGIALTPASAEGDLIQVELKFCDITD